MGFAASSDAHLHIPAFQFELGDALIDNQIYEFFQFFLIHRMRPNRSPKPRLLYTPGREVVLDLNGSELLVPGGKHFASFLGHQDHVFDANSPLSGQIHSRLDCDHHARL
jgi:hypothetical protein